MNTVPNKPKTTIRGVRVPDEEWHPAQAKAKAEGETVTDVVRRALREYVEAEVSSPRGRGARMNE
jgi:hypothetical protein